MLMVELDMVAMKVLMRLWPTCTMKCPKKWMNKLKSFYLLGPYQISIRAYLLSSQHVKNLRTIFPYRMYACDFLINILKYIRSVALVQVQYGTNSTLGCYSRVVRPAACCRALVCTKSAYYL